MNKPFIGLKGSFPPLHEISSPEQRYILSQLLPYNSRNITSTAADLPVPGGPETTR
jgi:hypothetical protein